ncbi:hypothetical protein ACQEVG_34480 [Streptomyces sp. CA-135486]|uniref:hypothetical protein n=1 Tax=Streptomyces sp. CA-135486 TaxID=3240049 RepID=UPI003D8DEC93
MPDMLVSVNVPTRGAWLRAGISRNGGPLLENEHVVWLQIDAYYADSRGFAGVTTYEGGEVRFHHDVGDPGEDVGRLEPSDAGMIETGVNPDGSTFREVWTPLPDSAGACGSWRMGTAQIVRVGRHVVHVDDECGSYFELPADVTA